LKRSRTVELFLVVSAAAVLTDCSPDTASVRRCVDENNTVVDSQNCRVSQGQPYHWYYGGSSGYAPIGTRVSGGSISPGAGSGEAESSTAHGVFGAAGEAHGGGGGEGGGE